ncbi:hypothetical protein [Amycolatopsis anabasis]|uniref:hypothetical protein n=1 Tax=Amycolatopsis anabasis TaxID=1840409 RepID=UPI00131BA308|nr:hypothetical protein [Amycolatopsis anabasis]
MARIAEPDVESLLALTRERKDLSSAVEDVLESIGGAGVLAALEDEIKRTNSPFRKGGLEELRRRTRRTVRGEPVRYSTR